MEQSSLKYHEEILHLTQELIRFRTVESRPEEITRCADFIRGWLADAGVESRLFTHNGVPSVIVMPGERCRVLLMSHFDVVEAEEPQFSPRIEDGKLFGRGAADDKYAVAVSMVLLAKRMAELRERGLGQESLEFGMMATGDEETGGYDGAREAIKEVRADFALALDGGGPLEIVTKAKGILNIRLEATGRSAHGSRVWEGDNAVDTLVDDLVRVRTMFPQPPEDKAANHWHATLNVGRIAGGGSVNQVPDSATAWLDIRYTEYDNIDKIVDIMRRECRSLVKVERIEPLFFAGESPYLELFRSAVGDGVKFTAEHGGSDARFLSDHGIPAAVWGPNGDKSHHGPLEYVWTDSLLNLFDRLDGFLLQARDYDAGDV